MSRPQILIWENPARMFNATGTVEVSWGVDTFNPGTDLNTTFPLNMWFIRHDNTGVTVLKNYPLVLIACTFSTSTISFHHVCVLISEIANHTNTNNSVTFSLTADDADYNVTQSGNHQLAWEATKDNPTYDGSKLQGRGFSMGFHIQPVPVKAVASTSSTSTSTQSTSSTSTSVQSTSSISTSIQSTSSTTSIPSTTSATLSPAVASNTAAGTTTLAATTSIGISQATVIGLSVGVGILFTLCVVGAFLWWRRDRKARAREIGKEDYSVVVPPTMGGEMQKKYYQDPVEAGTGRRSIGVYEAGTGRKESKAEAAELDGNG